MLNGGGYSEKFKELSKDGNDKLSKSEPLHAQQLAARDRARKLSLETNRRRRALELKKRLEAQKEAKRREEVLEERRKKQQEATHKFQRQRKASPRVPSDKTSGKPYSNTQLHDGIHMAHGYRVDGVNGSRGYQQDTPNLEDALRLVGGYTSHNSYGSHTAPAGSIYQYEYSQSDDSLHRKYGMDSNANATGSGYHGYSPSATATTYTSNHGMPVKQFQQDLQDQQRKFLEEQAKSLHEFNEEIMKEASPTSVLERSDSLSSLDSLEEHPQTSKKDKDDTRYSVTKTSGPAVTVNYYTKGHFTSPADTKIHQQPKQTSSNNETDISNGKLFVSNQRTFDREISSVRNNQYPSNELHIEETSETDIVSEAVEERKPVLLQGSGYHSRSSLPRSYADAIGNQYLSRTSETWVPQASYESSHVNSGHAGVSAAFQVAPSGISSASSARTRNLPAKPSATVFTVVPNTNGSNISHQTHQVVNSTTPSNTQYTVSKTHEVTSSPNRTKERAAVSNGKEQRGVQFNETPNTSDKHVKKASNSKKLAKEPVRSILKKTNSDQPAKLGGFKVRDSLEISRSSPGRKKSVRWTDNVEYEIDKDEAVCQDSPVVGNGYDGLPSDESKDAGSSDASSTQSRPMSSVSGRDNRTTSTQEKQKGSSKSKSSSYHNSSYAASYASKTPSETPSSTATASTGIDTPASKPARNGYKNTTSANKNVTSTAVKNGAVHNANGLRLDKTPTDAEINWLWDKVRTCLNSRDEMEEEQTRVVERPPSGVQQSRQLASVTSQYIDGGRITANLRIMSPQANAAAQSRNNSSVPRWRTSSDSGSYLRRTALLHQRRQHSAISKGKGNGGASGSTRQGSGHQQPVPSSSHQGPSRTVTMPPPHDNDVSDSLLAFQRAEQLVNDNIPEADIAVAIDNHRSPGNQDKVPISALSMEEQRILESLDRLNDRLRSVAPEVSPYMAITPKPPPFYYKPRKAKLYVKDNQN
ncbi:uncharacterized protein [Amphiura filiformis]|uniref:uncharacterized protein isoform X2 n=1 Tax=Amphiura filiformis TaxID=82378 RepID=UPI003B21F2FE